MLSEEKFLNITNYLRMQLQTWSHLLQLVHSRAVSRVWWSVCIM